MNTVSKLSIAGAFGALVALTPSGGGALAGPVGVGASAVTPLATPVETVKWVPYCGRRWVSAARHWHPGYWHRHARMFGPTVATDFAPTVVGPTVATDFGFGPTVATGPVIAADIGTTCEWVWNGFNWRRVCPRAGVGLFGSNTGLLGGGGFLGIF